MAITALQYARPIRRSSRPTVFDYELLEAATTLAEQGHALESLAKILEHLFPERRPIASLQTNPFQFVQGSSRVSVSIDSEDLVIRVPLVRLPSGGSAIAALRHVLTEIAGSGQLYQPRLRGDDIHIEYRDPLARLHPAKVIEVLRRMPAEADANDDWLVGQFSAQPLDRPEMVPLDAEELRAAQDMWAAHWNEIEELLKECQRKRSAFFLNELTAYAFYRVRAVLPLNGFLVARLTENASMFNNADRDPLKREASLAKCIKDMRAVPPDEFQRSLGHAEYGVSPLRDGTAAVLHEYSGPGKYRETIDQLRGSGKAMDATLALISTYYYLLAQHSWSEAVEADILRGLESASGKPWREAAGLLFEQAKVLAALQEGASEEAVEDDDEEEEGEDRDACAGGCECDEGECGSGGSASDEGATR